jgi:hypothetical protein
MKAGTTELSMQLAAHPEVCFCDEKEPHFFVRNPDWKEKLDNYHQLFQPQSGQITGEASTSYSFLGEYPEVVERLFEYNPAIKLLLMVRHPIDRIKSHYAHRLMHGIAELDPEAELAIRKEEYLNRSRYGYTLEKYLSVFPREQLLILYFDEYTQSPQATMEKVFAFLGLEPISTLVSARNSSTGSNRGKLSPVYYVDKTLAYSPPWLRRFLSRYISVKLPNKPRFSAELEQSLHQQLEPDIALFEQLSGREMSAWRVREQE